MEKLISFVEEKNPPFIFIAPFTHTVLSHFWDRNEIKKFWLLQAL